MGIDLDGRRATKCAEPRTLTNSQLALAPLCRAPQPFQLQFPTSVGRLKKYIGPLFPSYKHFTHPSNPSSYPSSPSCDQPSSSWHITPLSSPWVFSLSALPPRPPQKPTSSTSSASRLFQPRRFPNRRPRYMRSHPQRLSSSLLPSSPTRLLRIPLARRRARSFVHFFRSTSRQREA